jgi:hypothetical protein
MKTPIFAAMKILAAFGPTGAALSCCGKKDQHDSIANGFVD